MAAALLGTGSGRAIITACRDSQVSQTGPGPITIFAEYLLAALLGQDIPKRTGTISVFDLYMTVHEKVKKRVLAMLRGVGPFPIALCQGATSRGITDAAPRRRYSAADQHPHEPAGVDDTPWADGSETRPD